MTTPTPNQGPTDPRSPEVLLPPAIWCSAGSEVGFDVTVTHRGTTAALLTLTVLGLDSRWAPEPAVIGPLEPGQSAQVTLTLVPERGALGARYPFVVAAEASSRQGERPVMGIGESTLTVDARERLVVAVVPPQVTAVFGKRVDLQLSNPGAIDRSLTLTSDDVGGAVLRLSANTVVVPAGQTSTVRGRIKVRHPRMFGSGGVHAVGITARDSGAPEHAEATVRARPLIRNGLRAGVILGLVLTLWVAAAVVFIPMLSNRFTAKNSTASVNTSTTAGGPSANRCGRHRNRRRRYRRERDPRRRGGWIGIQQRRERSGQRVREHRRPRGRWWRCQPTGRDGDRTGTGRGDRQGGVDQPRRRRGRGGDPAAQPARPGRVCGAPSASSARCRPRRWR